jgi:hypothetical protein
MSSLPDSRVRDLIATAQKQLALQSYDAAIDSYRTALAELAPDTPAATRSDIEGCLAAAEQARDTSRRVSTFLAEARYQQTAGRLAQALAAAAEALSLDPSNQTAAQLREQLLAAAPELATVTTPAINAAPPSGITPASPIPDEQPKASAPPPEPQPIPWESSARPVEPPPFRMLEDDVTLFESGFDLVPSSREGGYLPEPEVLSILDPKPHPEPADPMRVAAMVLSGIILSLGLGAIAHQIKRAPMHYVPSHNLPAQFTPPVAIAPAPNAGPEDDTVYFANNGDTLPVLRFRVDPEYADYHGTVGIFMNIEPDGKPSKLKVLGDPGPNLAERAIEAVNKWRYRPATRGGEPVPIAAQVEVHFR